MELEVVWDAPALKSKVVLRETRRMFTPSPVDDHMIRCACGYDVIFLLLDNSKLRMAALRQFLELEFIETSPTRADALPAHRADKPGPTH